MPTPSTPCYKGDNKPMKGVRWWALWGSLILGACAPSIEPLPLPTTTLIPSTPITTPLPPTPLPTLTPNSHLALPSDLSVRQSTGTDEATESIVSQAQSMVRYGATTWGVSLDQITVLEFSRVVWFSADLGCVGSVGDSLTPVPIEGFRMVIKVDAQTHVLHQANGGNPKTCEDQRPLRGEKYGLVLNDPIAEEFIALAKAQLADELPTSATIELEEIRAYTWLDSSLGCPFPNQRYSDGDSAGYRIVLRANNQRYFFHTAFDRMIRCVAEYEVLPP
ncbi:MAG: hypothetical protein ACOYLB_16440 [Phototrophicaceae bacterium]